MLGTVVSLLINGIGYKIAKPKITDLSKTLKVQKLTQLKGHNGSIYDLSAGAQTGYIRSAGGDGWIVDWEIADPDPGKLFSNTNSQLFSILQISDALVVGGNSLGGIHWISKDGTSSDVLVHTKGVFGFAVVDDFLFSIGGGGRLVKSSIKSQKTLETLQLTTAPLRSVVSIHHIRPNSSNHDDHKNYLRRELVVGSSDGNIYIVNPVDMTTNRIIEQAHDNSIFALCYIPSRGCILSGGRDAMLKTWDAETYTMLDEFPAHMFTINDIVHLDPLPLYATASRDKTIKVWSSANGELLKVLEGIRDSGHLNSVNTLYWDAATFSLISASDDRSIIIWRIQFK